MADGQTSINIPQLIAVALVGFFAIRWLLNKPSSPASGSASSSSSSSSGRQTAVDVNKVNQISAMFPQLDRRTIAWDLQRNGGNVSATTERVLSPRGLEQPPPSFRPDVSDPTTATAAGGGNGGAAAAAAQQKSPAGGSGYPDLITRYNLHGRIGGKGKEPAVSSEAGGEDGMVRDGWSSDRATRAEGLRKRKEEMVLAARRKMEERLRREAEEGAEADQ